MEGTVRSAGSAVIARRRVTGILSQIPLIYYVFLLVMLIIYLRTPSFFQAGPLVAFVRGAAPLIVVAVAQMFVLVSGELDLSVGSLMTVCAAVASKVINNDPTRVGEAFLWIFGIAILVGLINGIMVTRFNVPSFVATLAMLLVAQGIISIITGGAAVGGLTENFRSLGRGNIEGTGIPIALIVTLLVVLVGFYTLRMTTFGRRVYAVGSNPLAAHLSGVKVNRIKIATFVICSLLASVASVLLVGYSGMASLSVGSGYEFQSISAAVLGGVTLTGGRGSAMSATAGALTLSAVFRLLNLMALPLPFRLTVQGLIILGAVAIGTLRSRRS